MQLSSYIHCNPTPPQTPIRLRTNDFSPAPSALRAYRHDVVQPKGANTNGKRCARYLTDLRPNQKKLVGSVSARRKLQFFKWIAA
jgi:hypothetical protein